jgi:transcriptional regulator NrdR family protein
MGRAVDIVKRGKRRTEPFNRQKLHYGVRAACLSTRAHDGDAEQTATQVCDAVVLWLEDKPEVTSYDLRRVATRRLEQFHPDAAYFYERYRHIM